MNSLAGRCSLSAAGGGAELHARPRCLQLPTGGAAAALNFCTRTLLVITPAHHHLSQDFPFQQMWITKEEYDEAGPSIVHRKCF